MAPAKAPFEIAIIGGGISGLVLAIGLVERNIPCVIYEQSHRFEEIGAGVGFGPNAARAMKHLSPPVYDAFQKVVTFNQFPEKKNVWFDFLDGYGQHEVGQEKHLFILGGEMSGAQAVHRAHFLDEMVKLLPEGIAQFNKRLKTLDDTADGRVKLKFHDGTEAAADAVIGCDGIKSRVRALLLGEDHPSAHPCYTHKYAYRGLIPVDRAAATLGLDYASNAKMHMGKDGHILTFAVAKGKMMNVVAFRTDPGQWSSDSKLTVPSEKAHVHRDFSKFGPTVHAIIDLLEPDLDCWGIFDLGDHPVPYYNKGRVCLLGDAGHASSPHHGAGAGMCVEDATIMSDLLADSRVREMGAKGIEAAFATFNQSRHERTQWLIQSSRRSGNLYDWVAEGVLDDTEAIRRETGSRCHKVWEASIHDMIDQAKSDLDRRTSAYRD